MASKPPLVINPTTLWEYPSQHYDGGPGSTEQGDRDYVGATPSWILWQLLQRYTHPGDLVVDPMCGSGTTLDVARDLDRRALGYDLNPQRDDIFRADARRLPLENEVADFVFIDPPYSTHVDYSDDPACIGKLAAGGEDGGRAYYDAMTRVIEEIDRILRPDRCMALYVSDSYSKGSGHYGRAPRGRFMPIGFELFMRLRRPFVPVDIVTVVRHNRKLEMGNFRKAAEEENFFLRGFNYLFIMRKAGRPRESKPAAPRGVRQGSRDDRDTRHTRRGAAPRERTFEPRDEGGRRTGAAGSRSDRGERRPSGASFERPYRDRSGDDRRDRRDRRDRFESTGDAPRRSPGGADRAQRPRERFEDRTSERVARQPRRDGSAPPARERRDFGAPRDGRPPRDGTRDRSARRDDRGAKPGGRAGKAPRDGGTGRAGGSTPGRSGGAPRKNAKRPAADDADRALREFRRRGRNPRRGPRP